MNSHDYAFPYGGTIEDRLIQDGRGGSLGGLHAPDAHLLRIDDLAPDPGTDGHANYRTPACGSRAEPESLWPFYCPYQPDLPPPAGYERLTPPPPAAPSDPAPEPVKYQDGLMTQALFDWSMGHIPEAPGTLREGWVGSSSDVIPDRLAEITIESSLLQSPPPDEPW